MKPSSVPAKQEKQEYSVSFYDEDDKEIGRRIYHGSYGSMIYNARRRGEKIGAKFFWHKVYLRKFMVNEKDYE